MSGAHTVGWAIRGLVCLGVAVLVVVLFAPTRTPTATPTPTPTPSVLEPRTLVSVKDFGAVGDGTTDDTAAIRAALSTAGARVHVPEGTYLVSTGARYYALAPAAGVTIEGPGTIKLAANQGVGVKVFTVTQDDVTISGITVDGSSANQSVESNLQRHGILVQADRFRLTGAHVTNMAGDGVLFTGASDGSVTDNIIDGCDRNGITTSSAGASRISITNNNISSRAQPVDSEPISGPVNDVQVVGNQLVSTGGDYALAVGGYSAMDPSSRWTVTDNRMIGGIYTLNAYDLTVTRNVITAAAKKHAIRGYYTSDNVLIEDNVIHGSSGNASIDIAAVKGAQPGDWTISGNTVHATAATAVSARGLAGTATITGNVLVGDNSGRGIYVRATADMPEAVITDNSVNGFPTGIKVATYQDYTLWNVVLRGNRIDNTLDNPVTTYGIALTALTATSLPAITMTGNQISTIYTRPLRVSPTELTVDTAG